jgi:hypothetical protein
MSQRVADHRLRHPELFGHTLLTIGHQLSIPGAALVLIGAR